MVAAPHPDLNPQLFAGEKLFGIAVLGSLGGANPVLPATMVILCITSFLMMAIFLYLSKTEAMLYKLEQDLAEEADREPAPILGEETGDSEEPGHALPPASDPLARPDETGLDQPLLAAGDRENQEVQPAET